MQKTTVNISWDYRLITDGRRYRIQEKQADGWHQIDETRWLWLAKWRLKRLRSAEAARRADATAIWVTVDD